MMQTDIILTTLNARYTHSAIGLRYLYANMGELQSQTQILEFTINENIQSIAEEILDRDPKIVGIGVYIWNASETAELMEYIKKVSPGTVIVLGGPEASYTPFRVNFDDADYIIQGEGDTAFYRLCDQISKGEAPAEQIIRPVMEDLSAIALPYDAYTDDDIANRYIYVEASRGCPFLCEFCLSSIDEKVRNFPLEPLLESFEKLWQRGVRSYKFIDRTFNLNMKFANAILDFFLAKDEVYFAHFEVIPDHFPESIKQKIKQFPPGSLQLEVGIQTLNPQISENISRPLKLEKIRQNLAFLENETKVHMHVDLIVGLPGENLESFGRNLNELYGMTKSEIQIGILKKLSGTTINRHDELHGMVYSDIPPYDVLQTRDVSFKEIQQMKRFARFWDIAYNSGNFVQTMQLLFGSDVYANFSAFSLWVYGQTQSTWKISLDRFSKLLFDYLTQVKHEQPEVVARAMIEDVTRVAGRKLPTFLRPFETHAKTADAHQVNAANKRQAKRV